MTNNTSSDKNDTKVVKEPSADKIESYPDHVPTVDAAEGIDVAPSEVNTPTIKTIQETSEVFFDDPEPSVQSDSVRTEEEFTDSDNRPSETGDTMSETDTIIASTEIDDEKIQNTSILDGVILLTGVTMEELNAAYVSIFSNKNTQQQRVELSTKGSPGQVVDGLYVSYASIAGSLDALEKHNTPNNPEIKPTLVDKTRGFRLGTYTTTPSFNIPENKRVIGDDAVALSLMQTTKRHLLYNSGLCLSLRKPILQEINSYIINCKSEEGHYGGFLGARIEGVRDFIYKKNFVELLKSLITKSTLEASSISDDIFDHISYHDLAPLAVHVASSMYDGVYDNFTIVYDDAGHSDTSTIAINKLINVDFSMFTVEELQYLQKHTTPTFKTTVADKNAFLEKFNKNNTLSIGNYKFILTVPSVNRYLSVEDRFLTNLFVNMQKDNASIETDVDQYLNCCILSIYMPWIKEVVVYTDETQTSEQYILSEDEAIDILLLSIFTENKKYKLAFTEGVSDFIYRSRTTHICYPAPTECPVCKKPIKSKTGFISVDPYVLFFTLIMQKLYMHCEE